MNDEQTVFGSHELTPAAIRGASFETTRDGYDPAQVQAFLEQVASAVEVLSGEPGPTAVRAELQRVSESTSRIVLAAQEAAERLRAQGADDAQTILADAKQLAQNLRDSAQGEIEANQRHLESVRAAFLDEFRDLYDRVGATLYRLERAGEGGAEASAAAPTVGAPAPPVEQPAPVEQSAPAPEPAMEQSAPASEPAMEQSAPAPEPAPEPAQPPVEQQPAPEQPPATSAAEQEEPATAQQDEPLVDLRGFYPEEGQEGEGEPAAPPAAPVSEATLAEEVPGDSGGASHAPPAPDLLGSVGEPVDQPAPEQADPTGGFVLAEPTAPASAGTGGVTLDDPFVQSWAEPAATPVEQQPEFGEPAPSPAAEAWSQADDEQRAENLLRGMEAMLGTDPQAAQHEPPPPPPVEAEPPLMGQAPDAQEYEQANGDLVIDDAAIRRFILESIHGGEDRGAVENYLRTNLGIADPAALVDQVLADVTGGGTAPPPA